MNQPGTYNAHLKRGVISKSKGSGSLQAALQFEVTHFQDGGQWADLTPFDRTVYLSFSGKAIEYTKKKLETLGYTEPKTEKDPSTGDQLMVFPEGVGDQAVALLCTQDTYQGEARERWDFANWGGGAVGEAADDEDVMKLNALW